MKIDEKRQRHDKWHRLVEEYLQSDLSQKAFREQRGLSLPQRVYYHGKFKGAQTPAARTLFGPVKIIAQDKVTAASEIKLSPPNGFQYSYPCKWLSGVEKDHIE